MKNNEVVVEKLFQNSGVTRRLWTLVIVIIIQYLYSAIMSYADTEALVAPV